MHLDELRRKLTNGELELGEPDITAMSHVYGEKKFKDTNKGPDMVGEKEKIKIPIGKNEMYLSDQSTFESQKSHPKNQDRTYTVSHPVEGIYEQDKKTKFQLREQETMTTDELVKKVEKDELNKAHPDKKRPLTPEQRKQLEVIR